MCDFKHTCVILSTHVWFLAHIYVIFTKHVRFLPKRATFNSIRYPSNILQVNFSTNSWLWVCPSNFVKTQSLPNPKKHIKNDVLLYWKFLFFFSFQSFNVKVIGDTTFLLRFRKESNFRWDYLLSRHQCSWQGLALLVGDEKGWRCQWRSWWGTRWSRSLGCRWGCRTGCGRCCCSSQCRCWHSRHWNWSLCRWHQGPRGR